MRWLALSSLFVVAPLLARGEPPLRVVANISGLLYVENDEVVGLERRLLDYFARSQRREIEYEWVGSLEELFDRLERGTADIGAGNLTVTVERQQRVDFADSHFPVRIALVEPAERHSTDVASLAGARLATIRGSTLEAALRAIPDAVFVYGSTGTDLFELVASGQADALAMDTSVALLMLPTHPGLRLGMFLSEEKGTAFATPKGSPLTAALNKNLAALKLSGIYFRVLRETLGEQAVEIVRAGRSSAD